jgi:putative PEP-CTERM system histidine kinase
MGDADAARGLFGLFGYGASSLSFGILTLVLITGWRGRLQGGLLVAATSATALWAGLLATQSWWHSTPIQALWLAESLRDLLWLLFLIRLLSLQASTDPGFVRILGWLRAGAILISIMLALPLERLLSDSGLVGPYGVTSARLILELSVAVGGLVLVEQVFRNTPVQQRWAVKFLCLGVGGLFAFDFFFFTDALLLQRMDMNIWVARGPASALAAPLIGVSAARNPQWSFDLFVSRKVVFHSSALFAAGIYLLIVAVAGHYIRYYGGEWSSIVQVLFFFGAALGLMLVLFSGQLRARLKVLLNKHFFHYRYDYREEWLHLIEVLSGKALQASLPERVIYALAELVDSPGGLIWLKAEAGAIERMRAWGVPEHTLEPDTDLAALETYLEHDRRVIDLVELRREPDFYAGLDLPGAVLDNDQLWLIVPLRHDEDLLGFVILVRPRAPQMINWEVLDVLKTAARQSASYLALERAARALAEARQFEGFNRLSAFVVHDLKNLIAQLSLVAKNAERHRHNPAFVDDALGTIRNSVDKMSRLLTQLRGSSHRLGTTQVDLVQVAREATRLRAIQEPAPSFELGSDEPISVQADADRLGAVIGHVIQNAQEATPRDGHVKVRVGRIGRNAVIDVVDTGSGMDADFVRERLFKPFDSTKGLTGMGVGAYDARELIASLGGRVVVESAPGEGTRFRMLIPTDSDEGADLAVAAD